MAVLSEYSTSDADHGFARQDVIRAADQCVMCGLCLPHCPTYAVARNEAESPRGRIALVRALHEGVLPPTATLVRHLDQCVGCLSCQTVCPANVQYEMILDAGRAVTRKRHSWLYRLKQSLLFLVLTQTHVRSCVKNVLGMCRLPGIYQLLIRLATKFPHRLRVFRFIPPPQKADFATTVAKLPATNADVETRVALINPCASELFADTSRAAAEVVLRALRCTVVVINPVCCCGALHQHSGYLKQARLLMRKFSRACSEQHCDVLVSMATGCGAHLNRYPQLLNEAATASLIHKHMDVNAFVLQEINKHDLKFKPLPRQVFVHKPCTQSLAAENAQVVETLLNRIPRIKLRFFQDELSCCGAGGINTLTQVQLADKLIHNKIAELQCSDAAYLVTSNVGCALHFRTQLRHRNQPIVVCHPISLLAQQLLYSARA